MLLGVTEVTSLLELEVESLEVFGMIASPQKVILARQKCLPTLLNF